MNSSLKHIWLVLLILFSTTASAQVDPEIDWQMMDLEDSRWIFDKRDSQMAQQFMRDYLRVRKVLRPIFSEKPERTTFVLRNETDIANGAATIWPYPLININPVMPSPKSALGEFSDPYYELVLHEYVHILNLYPAHGIIRLPRWIFGTLISPNMLLPRWYIEGLAVYIESYFGDGHGRLHSQYVEGLSRAFTLKKRWSKYTIDQLNDAPPDWIGGGRPYIMGGMLWAGIALEKGNETIESLNQAHSRRIPYFVNGAVENETGLSYSEWLEKSYQKLEKQTRKQLAQLSKASFVKAYTIRQRKGQNSGPKVSPNGKWLAFLSFSNRDGAGIALVSRGRRGFLKRRYRIVNKAKRMQKISWSKDSQKIYYDAVGKHRRFSLFSDIHVYDLKSKKSQQLTKGLRLHTPTVSPDGQSLFAVQNHPQGQRLVALDLQGQNLKTVYEPEPFTHLIQKTFLNENELVFTYQPKGGPRKARVLNIETGKTSPFLEKWTGAISFVHMTKKGLLFSSTKSGVENLYLFPKLKSANQANSFFSTIVPVTHTRTRVTEGDFGHDKGTLLFTQMTDRGDRIYYSRSTHWRFAPKSLPKIEPLYAPTELQIPEAPEPPDLSAAREYSPWYYMIPRYWTPYLFFIPEGTVFQAITSASDPLGKHLYSVIGQVDTLTNKPGVSASFINNSTSSEIGLSLANVYSYFYSNQSILHNQAANLYLARPLSDSEKWSGSLFFDLRSTQEGNTEALERQGPGLSVGYSDITTKRGDITPTGGGAVRLSHTEYLEDISTTPYGSTNLHFQLYNSTWLPKGHAWALTANGVYAPELRYTAIATSTISARLTSEDTTSHQLRGYPSGVFVGKNVFTYNLEYRLPLLSVFKGWGTLPIYLKNIHARVFFDSTSLDGIAYEKSAGATQSTAVTKVFADEWFSGYGVELISDWTTGYYLPISLKIGLHQGMDKETGGDLRYFFGFIL